MKNPMDFTWKRHGNDMETGHISHRHGSTGIA